MQLIGQKINLEREIVSHIQIYLMNLLNTQDIVYKVDGWIELRRKYPPCEGGERGVVIKFHLMLYNLKRTDSSRLFYQQ